MYRFSAYLAIALALAPLSASAAPSDDLAKTKQELKTESANVAKLEAEEKKMRARAKELRDLMVKASAELQKSEAELSAIEEKIKILHTQIDEKTKSLAIKKKNLAAMVQTSLKLAKTPPEAIIVMPGDVADNMKASRALKMTSDKIKQDSEDIKNQVHELEELQAQINSSKDEAKAKQLVLSEKAAVLKKQMAEHYDLQKKLRKDKSDAKAKAAALAKKADDLQGLISSLEQEQKAMQQEEAKKIKEQKTELVEDETKVPSGDKGTIRSFKAAKGDIRVPCAGRLTQKFGAEDKNETSKGVTITTRDGAQVTAPFDGEVLFTGPFMNYGKVIIIRHSDGYHSLLAGMAKIDVPVGEMLTEGEPIGTMGDKENELYMELRENNRPIDPAGWVRGMRK